MGWIVLLFRVVIGVILIIAGWAKSQATDVFAKVLLSFGSPKFLNRILARVLPWFEIGLGLLLVAGLWPRFTVPIAIALLIVFSLALGLNLIRGNVVECGCFGVNSSKISWKLVLRNAFLILLLGIVYFYVGK